MCLIDIFDCIQFNVPVMRLSAYFYLILYSYLNVSNRIFNYCHRREFPAKVENLVSEVKWKYKTVFVEKNVSAIQQQHNQKYKTILVFVCFFFVCLLFCRVSLQRKVIIRIKNSYCVLFKENK